MARQYLSPQPLSSSEEGKGEIKDSEQAGRDWEKGGGRAGLAGRLLALVAPDHHHQHEKEDDHGHEHQGLIMTIMIRRIFG